MNGGGQDTNGGDEQILIGPDVVIVHRPHGVHTGQALAALDPVRRSGHERGHANAGVANGCAHRQAGDAIPPKVRGSTAIPEVLAC